MLSFTKVFGDIKNNVEAMLQFHQSHFILTVGFAFLVGMFQSYGWVHERYYFWGIPIPSLIEWAVFLECVMITWGGYLSWKLQSAGDGGSPIGEQSDGKQGSANTENKIGEEETVHPPEKTYCHFKCEYKSQAEALLSEPGKPSAAAYSVIFAQLGNGLLVFSLAALAWISGELHWNKANSGDALLFSGFGFVSSLIMGIALAVLIGRYVPAAVGEFKNVWGPILLAESRNAQTVALWLYGISLVSFLVAMLPAIMIKDAGFFTQKCPIVYMESTYLQSDLTNKKLRETVLISV